VKKLGAAAALLALAGAACLFLARRRAEEVPIVCYEGYPLEGELLWVYEGPGGLTLEREVSGDEEVRGRRYRRVVYKLPMLGRRELPMRHTAEGVVTFQGGREHLLLRFPMVEGDSWTIDLPSEKEVADCTVLGEEEIEFKGRRRTATRLEVRRRTREGSPVATDYEWYAQGFGLVKMEVTHGVRATFVLRSFSRMRGNIQGILEPIRPHRIGEDGLRYEQPSPQ